MNNAGIRVLACGLAAAMVGAGAVHAALIGYEPFDIGAGQYTTGALTGQNPAVSGFSNAWTSSGFNQWSVGNAQVQSGGLTYTGLPTSGGSYSSSGITCREVTGVDFSDPNLAGTYYMSFLFKYNSTPPQAAWKMFEMSSAAKERVAWLGSSQYSHPGDFSFNDQGVIVSPNDNDVHLFVFKMDFAAGANNAFRIWNNPSLTTEPVGGGQTASGNYAFKYLGIFDSSGSAGVTWDELRIGTTYADVVGVPEPSGLAGIGVTLSAAVLTLFRRRSRR